MFYNMGCATPLKSKGGDLDGFLSSAGLNSSEAINVLTSRDCFDTSLHSFETNTPNVYPKPKKRVGAWGDVFRQLLG